MTLDEAIKMYTNNAEYERTHGSLQGYLDFRQLAEWLKELKQLREQTRWIPVSQRPPEIQEDVLLSLRSLDVEVGFRAKTEPYYYCHDENGCYIEPKNVLAWQPKPEPYKIESENE